MINKIPESDARWSCDEFIKYFSQMGNIEDYLRFVKKEVINSTSSLVHFMMSSSTKIFILRIWSLILSLLVVDFHNLFLKNTMSIF